jgi:hypothetical protein
VLLMTITLVPICFVIGGIVSEEKERTLRSFVKRFVGDDESERRETREVISSILNTGDKAKTEVVRLVAKEVRNYVEALDLHKDLHQLLTNYSLEINASFSLKPLDKENKDVQSSDDKESDEQPENNQ